MKATEPRIHVGAAAGEWAVPVGLSVFLLLLLYDGAIRKWLFPGAEQVVFIIKDSLLFALLAYAVSKGYRQPIFSLPPAILSLFLVYAAWVILQIANPSLPNILVAIWGLKAHLLYAGIILLLPVAFARLADLFRFLTRIYPLIVVPVCAMAFFQIALPADAFLNQSIMREIENTAYFGDEGLVRVTGTFSYISGMTAFVQASTLLGVGLFLGGSRSPGFMLGLATVIATLPATGSRGVIVSVIASIVIMVFAATVSRLISLATMLRVLVVMVILLALSLITQEGAWTALMQRSFAGYDDENRIFTSFTNAFDYFDVAGFFGFGTGAANHGAPALSKDWVPFSWLPVGGMFEEESGRIVLELGMIGWLFSFAFRVALLFWAMSLVITASSQAARWAIVTALPIMAYGAYVGNGVFAPPIGASYFWFCVALLAMAQYEHRLQQARLWE